MEGSPGATDSYIATLQEDLRSQLNLVLNLTDLLLDDVADDDRFEAVSEDLASAGRRAQAALEDVLEKRKLDAGLALDALRRALEVFLERLPDLDAAAAASPRPDGAHDVARIEAAARRAFALAGHRAIARPVPGEVLVGRSTVALRAVPDKGPAAATILVVDDSPTDREVLARRLGGFGHRVLSAEGARAALAILADQQVDLVLLDLVMPEMNGYELLEVREDDERLREIPVIMVSARTGLATIVDCIEMGAEDYLPKPFDPVLLEARVNASLERKRLADQERALLETVRQQAESMAELNTTLESRVRQQVDEIGRLAQLRRFLSPQVADAIVSSGDQSPLETHRREIAVLFCDLRGFTAFAESSEPEEVMDVLADFHEVVGALVHDYEATVGFFAGDGLMVFFNDPVRVPDPARRAVRLAVRMREAMAVPMGRWRKRGHELGLGVGVAQGYATLGRIGFEGRYDYGAIGSVVNLAARLCDQATPGQILISGRVQVTMGDDVEVDEPRDLSLKGFHAPVRSFNVR